MADEEDFRQLQAEVEGIDPSRHVDFAGGTWALAEHGDLVALLRYAALANAHRGDNEEARESAALAATHRVLSECIAATEWQSFERAAFDYKATEKEVVVAVQRVIEILCARKAPAAIKLLAWAAGNLGELDGMLLKSTGQGMAGTSARALCNIVFTLLIEQTEAEKRAEFIADLNSEEDPEKRALNLALEMIERKRREAEEAGEQPEPPPAPASGPPPGYEDEFTIEM